MALFVRKLGVDLGTVNVMVYANNQIVLQEPAMVALTIEDERVVAVGQEARDMYGRHPEHIEVIRPLRDGVIADYEVTEAMLRYFLRKIGGRVRTRRPEVMISVPYGVTSVEKRAVHEATIRAGARVAYLLPEPLLAALGAGLPISTPAGNMVFNLGGGISEAAVLAMNGIVVADSVRMGGMRLDDAIINYIRRKYSLVIGEPTAESIKIQIGAAVDIGEELSMEIQGRDQVGGLPRTITVTTSEVVEAIEEPLAAIVGAAKSVLEKTPPELASDIIDRGIVLTGGGAMLRGIDEYVTRAVGVPAYRTEDPMVATAVGAGRALDDLALLRRMHGL
ncbi:MAG TPA: rod shape-determining protein [Aggregatilinea sp.]|jgi:rod shape-determining protein MreB|uniref:rod shape-determining protein n=1 Tax=Aggregatilinea sp. TaxID=2806333 RepID=UPI002B680EDA|nr:rod shape-determining protein [Aggregatilinea sp.]HML21670.1 rod shape-determining protein [Aggregatilinea sp.]